MDPRDLDKIPCPVLRALVNEGRLAPDAQGRVTLFALDRALKSLALTLSSRALLLGAAAVASRSPVHLDLLALQGGILDHAGDTRILRHGFSQERLDWLLSFSTDGAHLTLDDVARAWSAARASEAPGVRGRLFGQFELAGLLAVFGDDDRVRNDVVTALYREGRLVPGWKPARTGVPRLGVTMARAALRQLARRG